MRACRLHFPRRSSSAHVRLGDRINSWQSETSEKEKKKFKHQHPVKESCASEYSLMQLKPWLRLSNVGATSPTFLKWLRVRTCS